MIDSDQRATAASRILNRTVDQIVQILDVAPDEARAIRSDARRVIREIEETRKKAALKRDLKQAGIR